MLSTLLLKFFIAILRPIVFALPTAGVTDALEVAGDYMGLVGWLFPLDTLFQIVTAGLVLETAILLFRWAVWLYNKIRGSG